MSEAPVRYLEESIVPFSKDAIEQGTYERHHKELGYGKFDTKLDIDIKALEELELKGEHVVVSIRTEDNTIIGYVMFLLGKNLHHSEKQAQCHALYIQPECRGVKFGKGLLQAAESILYHHHNCRWVQLTSNTNKDIGNFLEHMGYHMTDIVYAKEFRSK